MTKTMTGLTNRINVQKMVSISNSTALLSVRTYFATVCIVEVGCPSLVYKRVNNQTT